MGMSVAEGAVSKYLRKNPLDKRTLAKSLESEAVRCWWLCDADFDGMTIWHKDYEGAELAGYLEAIADAADGRG